MQMKTEIVEKVLWLYNAVIEKAQKIAPKLSQTLETWAQVYVILIETGWRILLRSNGPGQDRFMAEVRSPCAWTIPRYMGWAKKIQ